MLTVSVIKLRRAYQKKGDTMNRYSMGVDFGNADCNAVVIDQSGHECGRISVPSLTSVGSLEMLRSSDYGSLKEGDYVITDASNSQFVGSLAARQGDMPSSGLGDTGRYWSERARQLLLTVSRALIPDSEYDLVVVTGLPIAVYREDAAAAKRKVRKMLDGTHEFCLNDRSGIAHVTVASIAMEGAGAIISPDMSRARQGVIDIGQFTTDLAAFNGAEPLVRFCQGFRQGVETTHREFTDQFRLKFSMTPDRHEVRAAFYQYVNSRRIDSMWVRGLEIKSPELRELIKSAIDRAGTAIIATIATIWNESLMGEVAANFARVLVLGGGSYLFMPHIQSRIPNAQRMPEPEYQNALGYARLAQRAAERMS